MLVFVNEREFSAAIPFGTYTTIASVFLLKDFESDSILLRSNSTKDWNFVRPSYAILSTDESEDTFMFAAILSHGRYWLFVTIGMIVSLPFLI